jgi:beta-glucuronidase
MHACPKFGIRKVEVKDGKICLNGRPVFLKGVGKHDEYPGMGRTIPDEIYQKDFEIIKRLNANAIRMSHFPHDEREIDMADKLGFLLWEETLLVWDVDFKNLAVHKKVCQQLEELIRRDINHPSVIIWSLGNEVPSTTPEAEQCLRSEMEVVRRLDPTRLITFATWPLDIKENRPLKFMDVISFNMYRGWYTPDIPDIVKDIQAYHDAYPEKAIIISEFGAGAIKGCHSASRDRWSEEYQEWVIEQNLSYMRKSPHISGCFIWNYVDYKDPARPYTIYESFLNNKGLLDVYRVPKKAYTTVAKIFNDIK